MSDIKLTFGKHKGKQLSEIPTDYVLWLAENAHSQSVKEAARSFLLSTNNGYLLSPSSSHTGKYASAYYRTYFASQEIEEMIRDEKLMEEEWEEAKTLRWTAQSGQEIVIRSMLLPGTVERGFEVRVDGRTSYVSSDEIKPVTHVPGIVAKIGRIGLTAERYEKLEALVNE